MNILNSCLLVTLIFLCVFLNEVVSSDNKTDTEDFKLFNDVFNESQNSPNDTRRINRDDIPSNSSNVTDSVPPRCKCDEVSACNRPNEIVGNQSSSQGSDILGIVDLRHGILCQNTSEVCCEKLKEEVASSVVNGSTKNNSSGRSHQKWKRDRCGQFNDDEDPQISSNKGSGDFPWIVSITVEDNAGGSNRGSGINDTSYPNYRFLCTGSLIHPSVVLTTANCVFKEANSANKDKMRVLEVGNKNKSSSKLRSHMVRQVLFHNQLYRNLFQYDLALLVLEGEVTLSSKIDTVCLPTTDNDITYYESMICTSSAHGVGDSYLFPGSTEIEGFILPRSQCEKKLRNTSLGQSFRLHESLLCMQVNYRTNKNETCEISNGVPLVCRRSSSGYFIQVGIASWNLKCNDKDVPIVYVNLPSVFSWIQGKMRSNHFDWKYFTLVDDDLLMRIWEF